MSTHVVQRNILGMRKNGGRGKSCQELTAEMRETHGDVLEEKEGAEASVVADGMD